MSTKSEVRGEPDLEASVARILSRNPVLHAFVSTRLERAEIEWAALHDEAPRSMLHGVPYSLKDTWDVAGEVTTAGSYRYRDRVPTEDSPVHAVFREAGAVLVGKTNLSDLMLVGESASWVGGVGKNPLDLSRTCGGSSGGAAAAVADELVAFDWGSDVGGSIRMPAAYCGVLGMRLSSETWPMHGDYPKLPESLRWMNGQGPITATTQRMRDVLRVAAPKLRTGRARSFTLRGAMIYGADPRVSGQWATFAEDIERPLRDAVGEVRRDHGLPEASRAARFGLAMWASHFEDLLESDPMPIREGVGAVLSGLVLRGRFGDRRFHPQTATILTLMALGRITFFRDRRGAERRAQRFRDDVSALWDRGYLIASPSTVFPAPKHGRSQLNPHIQTYAFPGNVSDATSLAVPFGHYADGLPRSVQIMGPPGSEDVVLEVGERFLRAGPLEGRSRAIA